MEEDEETNDPLTSNTCLDQKYSDTEIIVKYSKNNKNIYDVLASRICHVSAKAYER